MTVGLKKASELLSELANYLGASNIDQRQC